MTNVLRRLADLCETDSGTAAVRIVEPCGRGAFRDSPISVQDWASGAADCAEMLRARGVRPKDRVLIALPTSESFLHAFWGVLSLGAVPVPLPSSGGWLRSEAIDRRVASILQDAAPGAAIADPPTARILERRIREVITPPFEKSGASLAIPDLEDGAPALIQYTSGSTGRPKGVVVTHGNMRANVESAAAVTRIDPRDRVLSWLPLYHDMGLIGGLIIPMWAQATAHLMSPLHFLLSPASWLQAISEYRATVTLAPNFAYSLLAKKVRSEELEHIDLSSLRIALNGAESVDCDTMERFAHRFASRGFDPKSHYPVYGLAEATLAAAFPPCGRATVVDHVERASLSIGCEVKRSHSTNAQSIVSVGRALPGHEIVIADPNDGRTLPERYLGEIQVRGPSVTPYYFIENEALPDRRSALRTGDLGYLSEGELYVVERLKDLIIIAGRTFVPSDVERIVEDVPSVRTGRVVAFGVWDPAIGTEKLVVVAEVKPTLLLRTDRIEARIRDRLQREIGLSPADIVLARPHSLELTSSGKLMRRRARDVFSTTGFEKPYGLLHPTWFRSQVERLWTKHRATRESGATPIIP